MSNSSILKQESDGIPKIIIQTWKTDQIGGIIGDLIRKLRANNPDFEYKFFTDEDIDHFIKKEYPEYYDIYNAFEYTIQRIDFFRYLAVYHYGGFYFDIDMDIDKSIAPLCKYKCVFPRANNEIFNKIPYLGSYGFGSYAKNIFFQQCLHQIIYNNIINISKKLPYLLNNKLYSNFINIKYYNFTPENKTLISEAYSNYNLKDSVTIIEPSLFKNNYFGEYGKYNSIEHCYGKININSNIKAICLGETGRLGNQILNILYAVYFGIQNKLDHIIFPYNISYYKNNITNNINKISFKSLLNSTNEQYDIKETNSINECNYIKLDDFWRYSLNDIYYFNIKENNQKVVSFMREIFNFSKPTSFNSNILHIHIRSGDIMIPNNGHNMIQPHCLYYVNEIERKNWDKVIIVSEDTKNPCINYLTNKYDNVFYFGVNSLETDINELLSATNLMMGRGSFIPALALFIPNLENIHYVDDGDSIINYHMQHHFSTKCIRHDEYIEYYNKIYEAKGWNYNQTIKDIMLSGCDVEKIIQ